MPTKKLGSAIRRTKRLPAASKLAPGTVVEFTPRLDSPVEGVTKGKKILGTITYSPYTKKGEVLLRVGSVSSGRWLRVPAKDVRPALLIKSKRDINRALTNLAMLDKQERGS